tara:strand:- start:835 stop:1074 length:240 start_codon:yes stop_codon:yes gene_type:complete
MNSQKSYSWLEIANMPLCCVCCGSRNVDQEKDVCLNCGADEGLLADEREESGSKQRFTGQTEKFEQSFNKIFINGESND